MSVHETQLQCLEDTMYIIIVGAGDIGTPLIDTVTKFENEVVVIDVTKHERNGPPMSSIVWY